MCSCVAALGVALVLVHACNLSVEIGGESHEQFSSASGRGWSRLILDEEWQTNALEEREARRKGTSHTYMTSALWRIPTTHLISPDSHNHLPDL